MKKLLAVLLCVMMVVVFMPTMAFAEDVVPADDLQQSSTGLSGTGTVDDPYLITSLADLNYFRDTVNNGTDYSGKYVLLNVDVDLSGIDNWVPIGTKGSQFKGHFNGNNKTISNLVSEFPERSDVGFFGFTSGGSVKNFNINNARINGYLDVGAVAGTPYTSTYENINVTGLIKVDGFAYVGGAFGKNLYANATNITVNGDEGSYIKADSREGSLAYRTYIGGLVGFMGEGNQTVKNCSSNVDVTGSTCDVGGITGIAHYGNTFDNCTYSGIVTIDGYSDEGDQLEIGGIAGVWHNGADVTIKNCTFNGIIRAFQGEAPNQQRYMGEWHNGMLIGRPYSTAGTGTLNSENNTVNITYAAMNGLNDYESLQDAVDSVNENEKIILHKANDEEVTVGKEVKFTLNKNGKEFNGTVSAASGYILKESKTEGDSTTYVFEKPYNPPYIPSTPTDNVTNSGTTGTETATTTADINTITSNGAASAVVDKATADKIVDKATSNQSTEVVVDVTTSAGTAENTKVTLPTDTVQKIAEKTEAEVTVKTDAAEVTLDKKAVEAVATKATGSDMEIVVEKTKDETKEMEFELKVVSGGVVIGEFDGGNVKVTVKLNTTLAALKDAALTCVYIADDGTYSKVGGAKNNDGTYTFTTTHFSSYVIMAEEEADEIIEKQTLEDIKNVKLVARSAMSKAKGKKAVKITWYATEGSDVKLDGVEIFRSTERYSGYGTKPLFSTTKDQYYNTAIKAGTKYYYKVRGYKIIDGKKYYTEYSTKAWRTVK